MRAVKIGMITFGLVLLILGGLLALPLIAVIIFVMALFILCYGLVKEVTNVAEKK